MENIKVVAKQFACALTKQTVIVECTYQPASETGSDKVIYLPHSRRCQNIQQCARSGLYEKCSLKGSPFV